MNNEMELARNEVERRINKIKKHFRDNRKTYITHSVTALVAAAVTVLICASKRSEINVVTGDGDEQTNFIAEKQEINYYKRVSNYGNALGAKGKQVVDLDTGKIFAAEKYAALDVGCSPAAMSKHLNNKGDLASGRRFAFVTYDEDEVGNDE